VALGIFCAAGTILGKMLGSAAANLIGQPAETGILVGSALGAFVSILIALYLSQNEKCRRMIIGAVGGLAVLDGLGMVLKGTLLPGFLGSASSFPKRLFFYIGAVVALQLIKGRKVFDLDHYRRLVDQKIEDYLKSSLPLIMVLLFRVTDEQSLLASPEGRMSRDAVLAQDVASIVQRLRANKDFEADILFGQLVRKLTNAGYETQEAAGCGKSKTIIWNSDLTSDYETFGLILDGETAVIEEDPVFKEGRVVRKGMVVPG
jgi:hypothetical protein